MYVEFCCTHLKKDVESTCEKSMRNSGQAEEIKFPNGVYEGNIARLREQWYFTMVSENTKEKSSC